MLTVKREERIREGCPLCDGCGREILDNMFFNWTFTTLDSTGRTIQFQYHSHEKPSCQGHVVEMALQGGHQS